VDNHLNARALIGTHDVLFVTLDTLRYDVARDELAAGRTPHLAAALPGGRWEERQSPGSFTYAAHHAFFAGFLPTPVAPGRHPRLFAARFPGSETTAELTYVFDAPDLVTGLAAAGYHTVCIGGVGFFNKQSALGSVLPGLFAESHWSPELGVTGRDSTAHQARLAASIMARLPRGRRAFLFLNVSALHQPNHFFCRGPTRIRRRRTRPRSPMSTATYRRCSRPCGRTAPPWLLSAPTMARPMARAAIGAIASRTPSCGRSPTPLLCCPRRPPRGPALRTTERSDA